MESQQEIWKRHTSSMDVEQVLKLYEEPALFQLELSKLINAENDKGSIVEIGCETGVTSMLLHDDFTKYLVDLNSNAIELAEKTFKRLEKKAEFYVEDMFHMSFSDEKFDIVFNAGVLGHFDYNDRVNAIKEYSRVLKKGGYMYLCVQNNYSIPYRIGKFIRKLFGRWQYPQDYKIYDFSNELREIGGLKIQYRKIIAKNACRWLDFSPSLEKIFLLLDKIIDFEGYLIVVKICKL